MDSSLDGSVPGKAGPRGVNLLLALALVCAANLPFGYWRAGLVRRSLPWLAAIHAPIPLVWLIRELLDLPWSLATLPAFVGAYCLGQWLGGRVRRLVLAGGGGS